MRLLFTALAFCFLFSSCNPDEELIENGEVFIGTWKFLGYLNSDGEELSSNEQDPCGYETNFIVESDGNAIFTSSFSDNIENPLDENGNLSFSGDCETQIFIGQADIINETIMNLTLPFTNSNNGFELYVAEITSENELRLMSQSTGDFSGYNWYFEKIN